MLIVKYMLIVKLPNNIKHMKWHVRISACRTAAYKGGLTVKLNVVCLQLGKFACSAC